MFFFVARFDSPNDGITPQTTVIAQPAVSHTRKPSSPPTFGWLLCPSMKGMPISLFFDVAEFNCPEKKSTNHGEHEPATRHLQQPHGQPRRYELVSWQMFPWRCGKRRWGVWRRRLILLVVACRVLWVVFAGGTDFPVGKG
jgi:hypothetical protein